tara:strand:+ start:370 stop:579 length:210 start_codon:yes stop_codon:yes gene_type:complete
VIDLIVAITIIAGLTSSMVYSVSTFTKIIKTSGRNKLSNYEIEIIKSAGYSNEKDQAKLNSFLEELPDL